MDNRDRRAINDLAAVIYRTISQDNIGEIEEQTIKEAVCGIQQIIGIHSYLEAAFLNCENAREAAKTASKSSHAIWGVYKTEDEFPDRTETRYKIAPVEQLLHANIEILNRYSEGMAWV